MTLRDPIRRRLKERGCPPTVVRAGLAGLIDRWADTVAEVAEGYRLGLDDYLNDLDGRQLIDEVLPLAPAGRREPAAERVARADAAMRALVVPAPDCLWGATAAAENGWTRERNWWYFVQPRAPGEELGRELVPP